MLAAEVRRQKLALSGGSRPDHNERPLSGGLGESDMKKERKRARKRARQQARKLASTQAGTQAVNQAGTQAGAQAGTLGSTRAGTLASNQAGLNMGPRGPSLSTSLLTPEQLAVGAQIKQRLGVGWARELQQLEQLQHGQQMYGPQLHGQQLYGPQLHGPLQSQFQSQLQSQQLYGQSHQNPHMMNSHIMDPHMHSSPNDQTHHGPNHGPNYGPNYGPNHGPTHGPNYGPNHGPNYGPNHGPMYEPSETDPFDCDDECLDNHAFATPELVCARTGVALPHMPVLRLGRVVPPPPPPPDPFSNCSPICTSPIASPICTSPIGSPIGSPNCTSPIVSPSSPPIPLRDAAEKLRKLLTPDPEPGTANACPDPCTNPCTNPCTDPCTSRVCAVDPCTLNVVCVPRTNQHLQQQAAKAEPSAIARLAQASSAADTAISAHQQAQFQEATRSGEQLSSAQAEKLLRQAEARQAALQAGIELARQQVAAAVNFGMYPGSLEAQQAQMQIQRMQFELDITYSMVASFQSRLRDALRLEARAQYQSEQDALVQLKKDAATELDEAARKRVQQDVGALMQKAQMQKEQDKERAEKERAEKERAEKEEQKAKAAQEQAARNVTNDGNESKENPQETIKSNEAVIQELIKVTHTLWKATWKELRDLRDSTEKSNLNGGQLQGGTLLRTALLLFGLGSTLGSGVNAKPDTDQTTYGNSTEINATAPAATHSSTIVCPIIGFHVPVGEDIAGAIVNSMLVNSNTGAVNTSSGTREVQHDTTYAVSASDYGHDGILFDIVDDHIVVGSGSDIADAAVAAVDADAAVPAVATDEYSGDSVQFVQHQEQSANGAGADGAETNANGDGVAVSGVVATPSTNSVNAIEAIGHTSGNGQLNATAENNAQGPAVKVDGKQDAKTNEHDSEQSEEGAQNHTKTEKQESEQRAEQRSEIRDSNGTLHNTAASLAVAAQQLMSSRTQRKQEKTVSRTQQLRQKNSLSQKHAASLFQNKFNAALRRTIELRSNPGSSDRQRNVDAMKQLIQTRVSYPDGNVKTPASDNNKLDLKVSTNKTAAGTTDNEYCITQGTHINYIAQRDQGVQFERLVGVHAPSKQTQKTKTRWFGSINGAITGVYFANLEVQPLHESSESSESITVKIHAMGVFEQERRLRDGVFFIQHTHNKEHNISNVLDIVVVNAPTNGTGNAPTNGTGNAPTNGTGNAPTNDTGNVTRFGITSRRKRPRGANLSADLSADMFFDCSNGVISHLVELTPSKTPPKHISHVTELTPETTSLDAHSVWEIVYQRWQEDQRWQDDEQQDGASTETQIPELLFSLQTKTHASALSLKRFCDAENQASKTPARKWDDLRQPCMTWAYVLDKANNADNVNNSVNMEIDLGMTFDCGVPVVQRVCLSETNSPIQSGASVTSVEWFTHDPKLFPDNIVYHACNRPSDNSTTRSSAAQNASASDVSHQKRMLAHTYVLDMQAAEKIEADTNVTCVTQVTDTQNTPSSTAIQHIKVVHGQPTTEPGQVDFMYTTDATLLNYVGVLIDGVFVDGLLCLNQSAANPCNVAKKLAVTNNIADTKDRIQRISCINGWFTQSFTINVDEALRNNPNVELVCAFHNGNQLTGDEATAFVTKLTKNKQTGALTQHERKMHGGQPTHLQGGDTDPKFYELLVQAENAAQQAVHLCTVLQEEQDRGIVMDAREQASKLTTAKELAVLFARHLYNAFQILEQRPNDAGHTEGRQRTRELYKKYRQLLGPTLHKTLDKCLDFVPKPKR